MTSTADDFVSLWSFIFRTLGLGIDCFLFDLYWVALFAVPVGMVTVLVIVINSFLKSRKQ